MEPSNLGNVSFSNEEEALARKRFLKLFRDCPIPDDEIMSNIGMFINSKSLSRILFLHHIYSLIVDTPGIIVEFGVRWGQNLSLFAALRGIFDTFNRHRKIVGFDTFTGFPPVHDKDGGSDLIKEGNLSVTDNYAEYLAGILQCQEDDNPMAHIKKFELVPGDACENCAQYLVDNPETIVALAYFDFDIYEPTRKCLELIRPHLVKGSVLGFDELNDHDSPGETIALAEVFGLNNIELKRYRYASRASYFVVR